MGLVVIAWFVEALAAEDFVFADVGGAIAYSAAGADPLAEGFVLGWEDGVLFDGAADGFEGCLVVAETTADLLVCFGTDWWGWAVFCGGHACCVFDCLLAAAAGAHEGDCGGEDASSSLARLDGSGDEGFSVSNSLDVVEDGDFGVAGEDEIAVHRVHGVFLGGDRELGCAQTLCYGCSSVDTAGAGWVPEWTSICKDVWTNIGEWH